MNPVGSAPRVLVGIATRNRAQVLPKAIASAQRQAYRPLEIAVLDDGSTDDTPALRAQFPHVHWQRQETSIGLIESRNRLMQSANADFYVSLDDDAWFLQTDEIGLAVARMVENPRLAAIAFDVLSPAFPAVSERTAPRPAAIFIGCGHLLRLAAVRRAGFYAPSPGAYGAEEKDLSLRLFDAGGRIELLPGVHVWHDQAWTGRDPRPLHRSGVCNELILTLRRCPAPEVVVVLPIKILRFFWFWLCHPSYFFAGLAGLALTARNSGAALRSRRPVRRETFWRMRFGRL